MSDKLINRLESIKMYIERNYIDEDQSMSVELLMNKCIDREPRVKKCEINANVTIPSTYFDDNDTKTPFTKMLFNLIDQKGITDAEVYRKAFIDRRHFSKIRSNLDYQPSKETVFSFVLALELNVDQAIDLLQSAGFAFNMSNKADLIIMYCIEHEIYDINDVNFALHSFDQPLLRV